MVGYEERYYIFNELLIRDFEKWDCEKLYFVIAEMNFQLDVKILLQINLSWWFPVDWWFNEIVDGYEFLLRWECCLKSV